MKALLIGCGNIGAMYDYSSEDVSSHAKAFQRCGVAVDFIEPNDKLAGKVAEKYHFLRRDYKEVDLNVYSMVSICTPTQYHTEYLLDAIQAKVPLVICEKPVAYSLIELKDLLIAYRSGSTKVLVNYIRRFLKGYIWLKQQISSFEEPLQSIHCNYYKGIMNYASHALDTVQFLTGFSISKKNIVELKREYDFFKDDPTITFQGVQDNIDFTFRGLRLDYPMFEIDLIFDTYRVCLTNGGSEVKILKRNELVAQKKELLKDYMLDVIIQAKTLLSGQEVQDNFEQSVSLNKTLIELIKSNNHE